MRDKGQKRRKKQQRRRAKFEARKRHSRPANSGYLYDQLVPGINEDGKPMLRVQRAACSCGGDLVFVDASKQITQTQLGPAERQYTVTWQRECMSCGTAKTYEDAWRVPVRFELPQTGPWICGLCTTQLTASPNDPPALDGHDSYCPSCESYAIERCTPGGDCPETRTNPDDGILEICGLAPGHEGPHGGEDDEDWVDPNYCCCAVTKTDDENAFPMQCDGYGGHDGPHYARGTYQVEGVGAFRYDLRWTTMSPREARLAAGEPAPEEPTLAPLN